MATKQSINKVDAKVAAQALEYLMVTQFVSRRKLYIENFFRGIFFSIGTVIGAAVAVTIILWILSLFDGLPFIQNISESIENTFNNR